MLDLTWQDPYIILTHCCTPEEKAPIWAGAQEFADEQGTRARNHYPAGGDFRMPSLTGTTKSTDLAGKDKTRWSPVYWRE